MVETLEELIQNRLELVEAHRKNNFTDGIHALLTDLYPDTAHFIYELLQNAEDMRATAVRFSLRYDRIDFEHNGTKRSFNIDDIDAITNIGHNPQKKDDPTSIGKFGVGFKAVFAYTATPIIHSGEYHFKIKDYFVPDVNVPDEPTKDENGVLWTRFSFPFNNPKKTASTAFTECCEGLKALNATAVLFLRHIKRITYSIYISREKVDIGTVERIEENNHFVTTVVNRPQLRDEIRVRWLRFQRYINIVDDQGKKKNLSIAVAFLLETDSRSNQIKIAPVKGEGRTFIYFPAEKEHSGLRFHINAPFASTVARDSVRNCEDNNKLIKEIAKLLAESLPEIKRLGMMNHAFFEVLPNHKDDIAPFYQVFLENIVAAFQNNDYLPTKEKGYISARRAIMGSSKISKLLTNEDLKLLTDIEKIWIVNASQVNSNTYHFLHSLHIQEFQYSDFAALFGIEYRCRLQNLLSQRNVEWFIDLYILCQETYDKLDYSADNQFLDNMRHTRFIRDASGNLYFPEQIFILPVNTPLITKSTPIVDQSLIVGKAKSERELDTVRSFFRICLKIREYGPKVEIENLLEKYDSSTSSISSDQYFSDLLAFANYSAVHSDIDFQSKALFFYQDKVKQKLYRVRADSLYLGARYGNEDGELLAEACSGNLLWEGYADKYQGKQELHRFLGFVEKCGIKKGLSIQEQSAKEHPLFYEKLWVQGYESTKGINIDYDIPQLKLLLPKKNIEISRMIWNYLRKEGETYNGGKAREAKYQINARAQTKTYDSTLIYRLKIHAWIPDKQGKFHKPADVTTTDLHPDFIYQATNNYLLYALRIGSGIDAKNKRLAELERDAQKSGMRLVDEKEYQEFEAYKLEQQRREQLFAMDDVQQLSAQELLKKQGKAEKSHNQTESSLTDTVGIPGETDVEATFKNAAKMLPEHKKMFSKVYPSSKRERKRLSGWYQGQCQMCGIRILGYNQKPYFVAKNIIYTQHLSADIRKTTELAWNSLCLCPNCAAKYDVCSRDLSKLYDQIMEKELPGDNMNVKLSIELDRKKQDIQYHAEHFRILKDGLQFIDREQKKQ